MILPLLLAALLSSPLRAQHPLDPLTPTEIEAAVAVARRAKALPAGVFFPQVTLKEPAKEAVRAWKPGRRVPRRAELVVYDRDANRMSEAVVELGEGKLVS